MEGRSGDGAALFVGLAAPEPVSLRRSAPRAHPGSQFTKCETLARTISAAGLKLGRRPKLSPAQQSFVAKERA